MLNLKDIKNIGTVKLNERFSEQRRLIQLETETKKEQVLDDESKQEIIKMNN